MVKVAVCLSSNGMVHSAFAVSLVILVASAGVPCVVISSESALNMVNRNRAVDSARKAGCSHVLFLDSDMTFPADTLPRLLAHNKDVVGCRYVRRFHPFDVLGRLVDKEPKSALAEAIELPGGGLLIKMEVFRALTAPYFRCPAMGSVKTLPVEVNYFDLTGYKFPDTMSEYYYFCQSARRAGVEVWADLALSMEIEHYGMKPYKIQKEK